MTQLMGLLEANPTVQFSALIRDDEENLKVELHCVSLALHPPYSSTFNHLEFPPTVLSLLCVFWFFLLSVICTTDSHKLDIHVHVWGSCPTRGSSLFFGKVTALGVAVLHCLVFLFDLACFFLPSFFKSLTCI